MEERSLVLVGHGTSRQVFATDTATFGTLI